MAVTVPDTEMMKDFVESLPAVLFEYVFYNDGSSEFLYVSPQSEDILGYPQAYFLQDMNNFRSLVHPSDLEKLTSNDLSPYERSKDCVVSDVRINHPKQGEQWIRLSSKATHRKQGDAFIWCGYIVNISDRKKQEADLERLNKELALLSNVDGLTRLFNRRAFDDIVQNEWKRALRNEEQLSLIIVDIDYFKAFNDGYGHLDGDDCLKSVAETLSKIVKRSADTIARFGGEEFVILLPNTGLEEAIRLAEQCRVSIMDLKVPHKYSDAHPNLTISLGVSTIFPHSGYDIRTFMEAADTCLYQAKKMGRNKVISINKL